MSKEPAKPNPADDNPDELVQVDDTVIGRAFRWSVVGFIGAALAGLVFYVIFKPKPQAPRNQVTSLTAPSAAPAAEVKIPTVKFTDITKESGINFVHFNGATGDKLLPETMGGGVAFLDFDGDGGFAFVSGETEKINLHIAAVATGFDPRAGFVKLKVLQHNAIEALFG